MFVLLIFPLYVWLSSPLSCSTCLSSQLSLSVYVCPLHFVFWHIFILSMYVCALHLASLHLLFFEKTHTEVTNRDLDSRDKWHGVVRADETILRQIPKSPKGKPSTRVLEVPLAGGECHYTDPHTPLAFNFSALSLGKSTLFFSSCVLSYFGYY